MTFLACPSAPICALVLCLTFSACQQAEGPEPGSGLDRAEMPSDPEPAASPTAPAPPVVAVRLTEGQVEVPQEVVSGRTTLRVYNGGAEEHRLAIEGEGVDVRLPRPIQPGESLTLEEELEAGTYRLYCLVDDHTDETLELEVVEAG